jgi:hypothetical protein
MLMGKILTGAHWCPKVLLAGGTLEDAPNHFRSTKVGVKSNVTALVKPLLP